MEELLSKLNPFYFYIVFIKLSVNSLTLYFSQSEQNRKSNKHILWQIEININSEIKWTIVYFMKNRMFDYRVVCQTTTENRLKNFNEKSCIYRYLLFLFNFKWFIGTAGRVQLYQNLTEPFVLFNRMKLLLILLLNVVITYSTIEILNWTF